MRSAATDDPLFEIVNGLWTLMRLEGQQTLGRPRPFVWVFRNTVVGIGAWAQNVGRCIGHHQTRGIHQHPAQRFFNRTTDIEHRNLLHLEAIDLLVEPSAWAGSELIGLTGRKAVVLAHVVGGWVCCSNGHVGWTQFTPFQGSQRRGWSPLKRPFNPSFTVVNAQLQHA